jgi:hypothetical protein
VEGLCVFGRWDSRDLSMFLISEVLGYRVFISSLSDSVLCLLSTYYVHMMLYLLD